jgi:hypothetical protein
MANGCLSAAVRARATRSGCRSAGHKKGLLYFLIRDHAPQLLLIGLIGHYAFPEFPLPLFRLGSQDMPRKGMTANDLARAGFLEALRRAFVCFQLRHKMSWISYRSY